MIVSYLEKVSSKQLEIFMKNVDSSVDTNVNSNVDSTFLSPMNQMAFLIVILNIVSIHNQIQ